MKIYLSFICLLALLTIASLSGQDNSTPTSQGLSNPTPDAGASISASTSATNSAVANLTPDQRKALVAAVDNTLKDYNQDKYDDALAQLDEADKISPKNPDLINLRGALLMKEEKWDQAIAQFNSALAINSKYFPARYNLGEVPYMQKKYADSRAIFQKLLAEDPKNELLLYKVFLTYLMEQNLDQAKVWLDKFNPFGNTPAYYFAQAAWLYNKKQDKDADGYIASSINIFPAAANNMFAEPLIQAGWVKRTQPSTP